MRESVTIHRDSGFSTRVSSQRSIFGLLVILGAILPMGRLSAMAPDNLNDFAERYAAAWSSKDPGSVAALFTGDGSLSVNEGSPAVGRSAIAEVAQSFMTALPDMTVLFNGLERVGDRVHFHWTLVGTNTGPGGTGKNLRISGYESWELSADGLVADSQGHFDAEEYERQLMDDRDE